MSGQPLPNEFDVLRDVASRLDPSGIAYMLTGSLAMNFYAKEDLILSKLHWAKDSRSETQLGDVRRLLATGCDEAYLDEWAPALEVAALLDDCRHE